MSDNKEKIKNFLLYGFAIYGVYSLFSDICFHLKNFARDEEELFLESHHFENSLEKANALCEIGYTFQRNEIIYKKISEKKWFAKFLFPVTMNLR